MSESVWWITLVVGLALAGYSLRATLWAPPEDRPRRWALLALTATLGVLLGGWVFGWDSWPGGLVAGLAVVELGPAALAAGRRVFGRFGGSPEKPDSSKD
jgi:hypothetical protein